MAKTLEQLETDAKRAKAGTPVSDGDVDVIYDGVYLGHHSFSYWHSGESISRTQAIRINNAAQ